MWQDVPNRGGRITINPAERNDGDIGLSSGWQGDNSGRTVPAADNDWIIVPIAKNADGSPVSGLVIGRIVNANGVNSQPMMVNANPVPYKPATLDTTKATLTRTRAETTDGKIVGEQKVASTDWAWAKCSADNPFPGTPDPTQICVKGGFDPKLLYQVVFTSKDDYVLGIGFAAFSDVASFFKYETKDAEGTANPVAGQVQWVGQPRFVAVGQHAAATDRARLHAGRSEAPGLRRRVADHRGQAHLAERPLRAARRRAEAVRVGRRRRAVVGRLARSRCAGFRRKGSSIAARRRKTCPKIMEHYGSAEAWALNLSPALVGTSADKDIPLPGNVRRYYIPSTQHGGGARRLHRDSRRAADVPGRELRHRHPRGQSRPAHRDGQRAARPYAQLGDEGHPAAGEQVSDAGGRLSRGSDEGVDGIPDDPRLARGRARTD